MTEALNLFVRRANAQSPIELVINKAGISEIVIVNIGQARNMARDLVMMLLGSTSSPLREESSGKLSAGDAPTPSETITVNTRYLRNGQARASR
jgi:hypothetical protein